MIATTIKSSIREKPFCFFMHISLRSYFKCQSTPYTRARQRPFVKPVVLGSWNHPKYMIRRLLQ
jgi:hypothetical protein